MSFIMTTLATLLVATGVQPGVAESAEEVHPLLIGAQAPDVTVRDIESNKVELHTLLAEKPTVLVFYRGGWCPYCNTHLAGLAESDPKLREMGYQILAISPDRPEKLRETLDKSALSYTLLSDSAMEAAQGFGVAFKVEDETVEKYKTYGIDLDDSSGEDHHLLPVPAVFILGTDGTIQFQYVNPNYKMRLDADVLLAAAHSLVGAEEK